MMKNNIQSEDMNPSQMSKKIIQEAIEKIKPDMDSLNQWYYQYSNGQKKRLSFDLDHLQYHVLIRQSNTLMLSFLRRQESRNDWIPNRVCPGLRSGVRCDDAEILSCRFRGSSDKISWKGVIENRLFQVFPKLRPFFSLIAKKEGK